jgi:antitoxin VapB
MPYKADMARTRAFKSGNSQAVRIPAELAYADTNVELTITRSGDVITIYPKRQDLKRMVEELRALPKVPLVEQDYERIELPDRDWD